MKKILRQAKSKGGQDTMVDIGADKLPTFTPLTAGRGGGALLRARLRVQVTIRGRANDCARGA